VETYWGRLEQIATSIVAPLQKIYPRTLFYFPIENPPKPFACFNLGRNRSRVQRLASSETPDLNERLAKSEMDFIVEQIKWRGEGGEV